MKITDFERINEERKIYNETHDKKIKLLANPRNAASGSLKQKNPEEVRKRNLSFKAFGLANAHLIGIETENEAMEYLKKLGFDVVETRVFKTTEIEKIMEYVDDWQLKRGELPYEIDGLVFKCNKLSDQRRLGEEVSVPKWATAFKFPPIQKTTKVIKVVWEMGAKDTLTPVAYVTPTAIGGVTVSKVTLHNKEEITRLGLMLYDNVVLERRGDVIPKIVSVIEDLRDGSQEEIKIPEYCPICNQILNSSGAMIKCLNPECSSKLYSKLLIWINALEIEDIGPSLINKMLELNLVNDPSDLYNLKEEQLYDIERMGKKSSKKVIENIQNSKEQPLYKVIMGLGIYNVGEQTAKDLANQFKTLDNLRKTTIDDLTAINNIGTVVANNIIEYFSNEKTQEFINRIIELGFGQYKEEQKMSNKLSGLKFCFTGTLSKPRDIFEKMVIDNGGEIKGYGKSLDYLVAGDKAGSKLKKAKEDEIKILNEEQFYDLLNK